MLESAFNWLIEQQLLVTCLIFCLLVLERYSLKWLSANFVYKLWLLVPASLLLVNLPEHFKPIQNAVIATMLITPDQTLNSHFSVNWALLYMIVFSLLAIIATVMHQRFVTQLRLSPLNNDRLISENPEIALMQSQVVNTPMVIGLFKTQLVLPADYANKTDPCSLALIIEHEKVHIKRKDNLLNILCLLTTLIMWFNPIAWLGYMSFRRLQELSCDEQVLVNKDTQQRILYSKALISCAANSHAGLMAY